ncbi:MAG: hypothetical protein V4563_17585 [Pseudomonadota bacterium]
MKISEDSIEKIKELEEELDRIKMRRQKINLELAVRRAGADIGATFFSRSSHLTSMTITAIDWATGQIKGDLTTSAHEFDENWKPTNED